MCSVLRIREECAFVPVDYVPRIDSMGGEPEILHTDASVSSDSLRASPPCALVAMTISNDWAFAASSASEPMGPAVSA
jgi:hypothetical protein